MEEKKTEIERLKEENNRLRDMNSRLEEQIELIKNARGVLKLNESEGENFDYFIHNSKAFIVAELLKLLEKAKAKEDLGTVLNVLEALKKEAATSVMTSPFWVIKK
ncbi:MAG: hypothetical protein ACFNTU_06475 [Catonella sp.]